MLIIKFFAQVGLQLSGALENTQKAFSRAAATLGPLLDLMGRARAMRLKTSIIVKTKVNPELSLLRAE